MKLKSIFFFSLLLFVAACSKESNNTSETTTLSGLKYTDILTGSGPSPVPGDKVTIHYTGTLLDGKKFDSSKDRNKPYSFTIGSGGTLLGWEEGVLTMKVGGRRKLIIPPQLAYGERGVQGSIPPNATVVFEIELLSVSQPE